MDDTGACVRALKESCDDHTNVHHQGVTWSLALIPGGALTLIALAIFRWKNSKKIVAKQFGKLISLLSLNA